ncbi:MAG: hypothetical protein ABW170_16475 [Candidatus Thiodiazotropha sp. L084R]
MTRTAGALIGRRRSSAFWGLGCPKTHHEIKDSLVLNRFAVILDLCTLRRCLRNLTACCSDLQGGSNQDVSIIPKLKRFRQMLILP